MEIYHCTKKGGCDYNYYGSALGCSNCPYYDCDDQEEGEEQDENAK